MVKSELGPRAAVREFELHNRVDSRFPVCRTPGPDNSLVGHKLDLPSLISAYQMASKSVRVLFREKSVSILLDATVAKFVERWHLKLESASGDICNVDLHGCQYRYEDSLEAPESFRESPTESAGMLTILLPSGECLYILETSPDAQAIPALRCRHAIVAGTLGARAPTGN